MLAKYFRPATFATAALLIANVAWAQGGNEAGDDRAVRLLKVIPVPVSSANVTNGLYGFDISWVDQTTQTYYLADRSNAVIDVADAKTDMFLGQIPGSFVGVAVRNGAVSNDFSGPNGVVTGGHCLFATDTSSSGNSRVVSFDLTQPFPPPVVSQIILSAATGRADELAFDPRDAVLLVMSPANDPPLGTFFSVNPATCGLTVGTSVPLDTAHGVDAEAGVEQPVWNPATRLFYVSVPQIGPNAIHGGWVSIPPNGTAWTQLGNGVDYCNPNGLTVGPKGDLFSGCSTVYDTAGKVWSPTGNVTAAPNDIIVDARTGAINARVLGVGAGDEVWFNAGDGNYYASGSGSPFRAIDVLLGPGETAVTQTAQGSTPMGVVDAKDQKTLQLVTTFNVPAVGTGNGPVNGAVQHPASTAHSVAANAANNHIFVPLGTNNTFSAFAVPNGGPVDDCETGCIAVFGHPDEN